ncbi:MAG: PhnD/SsuA/transferrin family substrate-binding protein, partial [Thermoflexales bacterium]|nr:PhnD/SsuA/transferrin family substrate-binding protein [Thermoflexales bacterium]
AVDSLVYDYAIQREPELAQRTKIVFRSEPFGIPPVVAGPQARPQVVAEVRDLMIGMAADTDGQRVLSGLNIDRFITVEDRIYDSARQLEAQIAPVQ